MIRQGIKPSVVTYTSLAKPLAKKGDFKKVETLLAEMKGHGLAANEYFLCGLMNAYSNAAPSQSSRAEASFREVYAEGRIRPDEFVLGALARAVGQQRCRELCTELELESPSS